MNMVRRVLLTLTFALAFTNQSSGSDPFFLEGTQGELFGPFMLREGETIKLGFESARIVFPSQRQIEFRKKISQTIIPELSFRQANVRDVIEFLRQASAKYAPAGSPQGPVDIVLEADAGQPGPESVQTPPGAAEVPDVTFNARYISLLTAIQIVARVTDLKCLIKENRIVLLRPAKTESIEHPSED